MLECYVKYHEIDFRYIFKNSLARVITMDLETP